MKYVVFYKYNIRLTDEEAIITKSHPWGQGREILDEPDPRYPIFKSGNKAVQPLGSTTEKGTEID